LEKYFAYLAGKYYQHSHEQFETTIVRFLKEHPHVHIVKLPSDACLLLPRIFIHARSDAWEGFSLLHLRHLPHWDNGRNHIIIDRGDNFFQNIPADQAIFLRAAFHRALIREGYDVQTLYVPEITFKDLSHHLTRNETAFLDRPLLASFKGKETSHLCARLVDKIDSATSDNVVILVEGITPSSEYNSWEYADVLLLSRFTLAPRGLGLHSYRLVEAMSAGCIPVIISDGYAWPEASLVDPPLEWDKIVIQVDEDNLGTLIDHLWAIPTNEVLLRHGAVKDAYRRLKAVGGFHMVSGIPLVMRRIDDLIIKRGLREDLNKK
jgi:hypothetical protein